MARRKYSSETDETIVEPPAPQAPKTVMRITCTERQWEDLWRDFHRHKGVEIEVTRRGLENALDDFTGAGNKSPTDLLAGQQARQNSELVLVRRASLFEFLKNLGLIYGECESLGKRLPQ